MVNHIPKWSTLVVLAQREHHDLKLKLQRFPCTRLSIEGTPENLSALSDHPEIEHVSLRYCAIPDLGALQGLSRLRRLAVAFGPLSSVDLTFCSSSLEFLHLARLRRLKDLSTLPLMPKLKHLAITHIHSFIPPDFRLFPNLQILSIWNTNWESLNWLSHLPRLTDLHISQIKVRDKQWKPILSLPHLRYLHGMRNVFGADVRNEFARLRPDVSIDQGRSSVKPDPQVKEAVEELFKKRKDK